MGAARAYDLGAEGHRCEGWSYGRGFEEYMRTRVKDRCFGGEDLAKRARAEMGGFDPARVDEILSAEPSGEPWKSGECLAECFLEDDKGARLSNSRPAQKNPKASPAGPDLAGLSAEKGAFLFGEVKTTGAPGSPPPIVKDMEAQLEKIMASKAVRSPLIRWILYMARGSGWEGEAHNALRGYMRGEYVVAGVLIRDAAPKEADLAPAFSRIRQRAAAGALVALYALYLPVAVERAGDLVRTGG